MSREPAYDKLNNPGGAGAQAAANTDDPEYDEELEKYGGQYKSKKAIGQVTIRLPFSFHPLNVIAVTYGFLPWLIPITFGIHFIITKKFIMLYGVLISVVVSLLNEAVLKPLIKEPRPRQSANKYPDGSMKHGMPSGHVFNSTATMVWSLLEVILDGPGLQGDMQQLTWQWVACILVLMLPVPWARWYNMDHTAKQCAVSLVLGTCMGILAFYIRVTYFHSLAHWRPWSDQMPQTTTTAAPEHHKHHDHHHHHTKGLLLL